MKKALRVGVHGLRNREPDATSDNCKGWEPAMLRSHSSVQRTSEGWSRSKAANRSMGKPTTFDQLPETTETKGSSS